MEQKEQDKGISQYKGLAKLLIKVVGSILFLIFLYLAYTPAPPEIKYGGIQLTLGDALLFLSLLVLLIAVIAFYDCRRKFLISVRIVNRKLNKHPLGSTVSFLAVSSVIIMISAIYIGPGFSLGKVLARLSSPHEIINLRNIALGLAGIAGLTFAGWRSWVGERQTQAMEKDRRIIEERRFGERFSSAIESLSKELNETSYPSHLGAIVALRDLAGSNNDYAQRCLDILCSCNQWMEGYIKEFADNSFNECYADRHLSENKRIANTKSSEDGHINLHHERRSQDALKSIAMIIKNYSQKRLLKHIELTDKMLCGINLCEADLCDINFERVCLSGANLQEANLQEANLQSADLQGTTLSLAQLENANLNKANLQMASIIHASLDSANLQEANLTEVTLSGSNLDFTNLQGANLQGAQLLATKLYDANLCGANLVGADLRGADIYGAKMQGTDMSKAKLQGTIFLRQELQGATIHEAEMDFCIFLQCNLYGAKIQDNNFSNIIFDEISSNGHIQDQQERTAWISKVREGFHNQKQAKKIIQGIIATWNATDKGELPKGLSDFQNASIIEKDAEGDWIISPSRIEGLKEFYRTLVTELDEISVQTKSYIAKAIIETEESYDFLGDHYPKIQKTLENIVKNLEQEFADKEE